MRLQWRPSKSLESASDVTVDWTWLAVHVDIDMHPRPDRRDIIRIGGKLRGSDGGLTRQYARVLACACARERRLHTHWKTR